MDLSGISTFADYFVIATGESHVQMQAMADRVRQAIAKTGVKISTAEGKESKSWILLDYGSIIIHIMSPKAREYYGLQQLWGDAREIDWSNPDSE
jgi:ribosome-associated protein